MRAAIMGGAILGSTLGGAVPHLWHGSGLSLTGLLFSCLGGFAGIWVAATACR